MFQIIRRRPCGSAVRLSPALGAALLALTLLAVVACDGGPIAESGSRADRVFEMANDGDSTAQTALGLLYERGLGVARDPAQALVWYRRAAAQGDALAEFHIGSLYERGAGVSRDYSEAAAWYQRASDKGNESAQAALAYLYDRGLGVERDFAAAEALYSRASESWAETDTYPAEATFATGRDGPALASPGVADLPIGQRKPEFSAGQEQAPAIEIDLTALDDVPESGPGATVFDGPQPIAGRGENFPLAGSSLTPPELTRVPDVAPLPAGPKPLTPSAAADGNLPAVHLRAPEIEEKMAAVELKPAEPLEIPESADEGLLIEAQPEPERTVLSVRELLGEEGPSTQAAALPAPKSEIPDAKVQAVLPEPEPAPLPVPKPEAQMAEVEPPPSESEASAAEEDAEKLSPSQREIEAQLASAEEQLIASLDAELDQEAAAFAAVLDAATEAEDAPSPLPPEPEIFLISLATYETEALAVAAWQDMRNTHAGLLRQLPYELQPIDLGDDGRFYELIVGPFESPVQTRSLCGALRAHGHVCRTIDR